MNPHPPRLPWLWDYDLDEATFIALLHGDAVVPPLDRDWTATGPPCGSSSMRRGPRSCVGSGGGRWRRIGRAGARACDPSAAGAGSTLRWRGCRRIDRTWRRSEAALLDRREPKDLADVWGFCCRQGMSLSAAIDGARGTMLGVFVPDVARALASATAHDWRLVRWRAPAPTADAFVGELYALAGDLVLGEP